MDSKWINERSNLEKYILIDELSYEEIGRIYGCSGANIKKVAKQLEIELKPRRNINPSEDFNKGKSKYKSVCKNCGKEFTSHNGNFGYFCCKKCSGNYQKKQGYKRLLDGDESIMTPMFHAATYKKFILQEQDFKCDICGCLNIHNGKELVFILDHIDGRASNNNRKNLRLICPNCDSQLDTYKSKNKNSDRYYYRYGKNK